jgi:hypothetical protein
MTDYAAVLKAEYPGMEWGLNGNDYVTLTWLSDTPKPTKAALDKLWPKVQHDAAVAAVRDARHVRYVAETDPMLFKALRDEEDGVTLADWKAAVAAIKADLPYPAAPDPA